MTSEKNLTVAFERTNGLNCCSCPCSDERKVVLSGSLLTHHFFFFQGWVAQIRFAWQRDQTKAKKKKEKKRKKSHCIITEIFFMLFWVGLNICEQAASAHFTPLILLRGGKTRTGVKANRFILGLTILQLIQLYFLLEDERSRIEKRISPKSTFP